MSNNHCSLWSFNSYFMCHAVSYFMQIAWKKVKKNNTNNEISQKKKRNDQARQLGLFCGKSWSDFIHNQLLISVGSSNMPWTNYHGPVASCVLRRCWLKIICLSSKSQYKLSTRNLTEICYSFATRDLYLLSHNARHQILVFSTNS